MMASGPLGCLLYRSNSPVFTHKSAIEKEGGATLELLKAHLNATRVDVRKNIASRLVDNVRQVRDSIQPSLKNGDVSHPNSKAGRPKRDPF